MRQSICREQFGRVVDYSRTVTRVDLKVNVAFFWWGKQWGFQNLAKMLPIFLFNANRTPLDIACGHDFLSSDVRNRSMQNTQQSRRGLNSSLSRIHEYYAPHEFRGPT